MKRRWAIVVLSTALGAALIAAPGSASASEFKNCDKLGLRGDVLARGLSCKKARALIKGFLAKAQSEGADVVIGSYKCHGETPGREMLVKCSDGNKRARWRGSTG